MPCYLLHILEQPEARPYDDPELCDLVGAYPRTFCTARSEPRPLQVSKSLRCLERSEPCEIALSMMRAENTL
jgi:hypothetical protein